MREAPFTSLSRGRAGGPTRLARAALMLVSGLVLLAVSPVAFGEAPPADYRVIVHPGRPDTKVSREFVANALLRNITRWSNDEAIRPADQRADSAVRRT